jgi:biopolymer transport protein ExbB
MTIDELFLEFSLLGSRWVLWLLVGLSVATAAVLVERWLHYRQVARHEREFLQAMHLAWDGGDGRDDDAARDALLELCRARRSPSARMVMKMLEASDRGPEAMKAMLAATRSAEHSLLDRNLGFLGTVGANAPFVGLFGTVIEILRVFHLLGESQVAEGARVQNIMSGISEALIATAVGLLVAIPAVVAFNALTKRFDRLMASADEASHVALALLRPGRKH